MYGVQPDSWYNPYVTQYPPYRMTWDRMPPYTSPPMPQPTQPTPPTAHQQTVKTENFHHQNSRNELRAAIFKNVLSSFPKLQKLLQESGKSEGQDSKSSCRFQGQISPPLPTPPTNILFPSMASNILDDEKYPGYFSFNDGMSPKNATSPSGLIPRYSPVTDLPPNIIQMLDQVMDNTPDLANLMFDTTSVPNRKEDVRHVQPPQTTENCQLNNSIQHQAMELTKKMAVTSTTPVKFPCDICNKDFASKANLRVHLRRHSGHKPYKCEWCSKSFNQKSTLRTHIRIHTGERPYQCKFCEKSFADYSTYTKHNRTHTGEKPYSCSACGKTFAQSGNMIRHQQTHKDPVASIKQLSPRISN